MTTIQGHPHVFKRRIRIENGDGNVFGDRRRAERRSAGWQSRYLVTGERMSQVFVADDDFSSCVLRDLTTDGAGLHCSGQPLSVGDRILLDLQLGERNRASIKVAGEVRHAANADDGSVSAGIEFTEVGDLERALLLRLVRDLQEPARQSA